MKIIFDSQIQKRIVLDILPVQRDWDLLAIAKNKKLAWIVGKQ